MGSVLRVVPQGVDSKGAGFFTELYGRALPTVVITTKQVVGNQRAVAVGDVGGWKNDGVVVGVSDNFDLACVWVQPVLPMDTFKDRVLKIGDSDGLRMADTVYVLGFADENLPAETVVDDIGELYATLRDNLHPPGSSGHAVTNKLGEVVGVIRGGTPGRIQDQAILINTVREEMPAMCGSAIP